MYSVRRVANGRTGRLRSLIWSGIIQALTLQISDIYIALNVESDASRENSLGSDCRRLGMSRRRWLLSKDKARGGLRAFNLP